MCINALFLFHGQGGTVQSTETIRIILHILILMNGYVNPLDSLLGDFYRRARLFNKLPHSPVASVILPSVIYPAGQVPLAKRGGGAVWSQI